MTFAIALLIIGGTVSILLQRFAHLCSFRCPDTSMTLCMLQMNPRFHACFASARSRKGCWTYW